MPALVTNNNAASVLAALASAAERDASRQRAGVESRVVRALASLLRRLGVVGDRTPPADVLCAAAEKYAAGAPVVVSDDGKLMPSGLSPPDPVLDDDLPF
jgi:hypothetical protein